MTAPARLLVSEATIAELTDLRDEYRIKLDVAHDPDERDHLRHCVDALDRTITLCQTTTNTRRGRLTAPRETKTARCPLG